MKKNLTIPEVEKKETEIEKNSQEKNSQEESLRNLRIAVKAHVSAKIGNCSNYAKGLINDAEPEELNLWLTFESEKLLKKFGQNAINKAFCNTRLAASRDTKLTAKKSDRELTAELSKLLNTAKVDFKDGIDTPQVRALAKIALERTIEYMEKNPNDPESKSFGFFNDLATVEDKGISWGIALSAKIYRK